MDALSASIRQFLLLHTLYPGIAISLFEAKYMYPETLAICLIPGLHIMIRVILASHASDLPGHARAAIEDPHLHLYECDALADAASSPEPRPSKKARTSRQGTGAGILTPQENGHETPAPRGTGGGKRRRGGGRGKTLGGEAGVQDSAGVVQSTETQRSTLPNGG